MKKTILTVAAVASAFVLGYLNHTHASPATQEDSRTDLSAYITQLEEEIEELKLGAFSVSLSVKDLKASKRFYENMGFSMIGGALEYNYVILKNETAVIGLFQGMFEGNILTFNPGWDQNGENIDSFEDVRVIQEKLSEKGIEVGDQIDATTTGPASFVLTDPDGNVIFLDQHR